MTSAKLPIILHVWAERRLAIDFTDLLDELGAVTLSSAAWSATAISATAAGVAGAQARVDVADLVAGRHLVTCRATLSNGDTVDRSLTLDVREAVYAGDFDRRGRIVPVWLDPDGNATLGVDWSAVLAEIDGHAPDVAIDNSTWPEVSGMAFSGASAADGVARARVSTTLDAGATAVIENRVTFSNGERDARNLAIAVGEL